MDGPCSRLSRSRNLWHSVRVLTPRDDSPHHFSFRSVPADAPPRWTIGSEVEGSLAEDATNLYVSQAPKDFLRGRLICFLPGIGGSDSAYMNLGGVASSLGFHSLHMGANPDVSPDFVSYIHRLPLSDLQEALSLRVKPLVEYLMTHYREEGWEYYFLKGTLDWGHIVVVAPHRDRCVSESRRIKLKVQAPLSMFSADLTVRVA